MPIQASDLTDEVKKQILNNIRSQAGEDRYREMISGFGEDGLIDIVLNQMNQESNSSSSGGVPAHSKQQENWYDIFIAAFWVPYIMMLAGTIWGLVILIGGLILGGLLEKSTGKMTISQSYGYRTEIDPGENAGQLIKVVAGIAAFICAAIIYFPAGLLIFGGSYLVVLVILSVKGLIKKLRE